MPSRFGRWMFLFACVAVIGLVAALATHLATRPASEGRLILATGGSDDAYQTLVRSYVPDLARNGVRLSLRPDLQGADTLKELIETKSIDGGVLKGGYVGSLTGRLASVKARDRHEKEASKLRSVGRLFLEPIWVFTREPIESLRDLKGKRILTGLRQSGGRRVAMQLLRANGVNSENSVLINSELTEDGRALLAGEADAAVLILSPEADRIQKLLRITDIRLMDFSLEVDAYTKRFPALSKVTMPRGSVEFDPVIPSAEITLLATSAALVVRADMDPSLVTLLTHAVLNNPKSGLDKSGDPILFFRAGDFPSAHDPEFRVSNETLQIYKSGELPFLLRNLAPLSARAGLPFSTTAFVHAHGAKLVLLIPLLAIVLPLMRALPAFYVWNVRRRLIHWYRQLKSVERILDSGRPGYDLAALRTEVERIDDAVRRIRVPLYFSDQLYDLRGHIDLVRQRLLAKPDPLRVSGGGWLQSTP